MKRLLLVLAAIGILAPARAMACGASAVCSDTGESLTGTVLIDDDSKLTWSTDDENVRVAFYQLKRYEADPEQAVYVATIDASGSCNTTENYQYIDDTPDGDWTYRLEVWTSTNLRRCAVDVVPE